MDGMKLSAWMLSHLRFAVNEQGIWWLKKSDTSRFMPWKYVFTREWFRGDPPAHPAGAAPSPARSSAQHH